MPISSITPKEETTSKTMQQEPSTSPGSKQPETPEHELHLAFCRLGFKPTETRKKVFKELIFVAVNDQCKSAEVDDPATLSGQKLERFIEGTTLDIMDVRLKARVFM